MRLHASLDQLDTIRPVTQALCRELRRPWWDRHRLLYGAGDGSTEHERSTEEADEVILLRHEAPDSTRAVRKKYYREGYDGHVSSVGSLWDQL